MTPLPGVMFGSARAKLKTSVDQDCLRMRGWFICCCSSCQEQCNLNIDLQLSYFLDWDLALQTSSSWFNLPAPLMICSSLSPLCMLRNCYQKWDGCMNWALYTSLDHTDFPCVQIFRFACSVSKQSARDARGCQGSKVLMQRVRD